MLKGKKICLRTVKEADLAMFHELDQDISGRGDYYYMGLMAESQLKKRYNETGMWNDDFGLMLIVNDNDEILGYINYFKTSPHYDSLEIGYILYDEKKRGTGIMTEALQLFIHYLFRAKKMNRLEIRTHPGNTASQKVAQKCGFAKEGVIRGAILYKESHIDLFVFGITRQDYYKNNPS